MWLACAIGLAAEGVEAGGEALNDGETGNVGGHGSERDGAQLGLAEVADREHAGDGEGVLEKKGGSEGHGGADEVPDLVPHGGGLAKQGAVDITVAIVVVVGFEDGVLAVLGGGGGRAGCGCTVLLPVLGQ